MIFGSFGNEPMQSCFVWRVVLSLASSVSVSSVYSCPSDNFDHRKLHILPIYASILIVYAHEILYQCNVYFLNGSHVNKFLYLALLSTWLSLESSYLPQLSTYTGATHRE